MWLSVSLLLTAGASGQGQDASGFLALLTQGQAADEAIEFGRAAAGR